MIRLKIRIATTQRDYFNTCMGVHRYRNTVWLLSSRTHDNKVWGKRDYIELHGNILHLVDFVHFLGNKHIGIAALRYIVTPYPQHI